MKASRASINDPPENNLEAPESRLDRRAHSRYVSRLVVGTGFPAISVNEWVLSVGSRCARPRTK